jgi:dUTP pyrophosphatase
MQRGFELVSKKYEQNNEGSQVALPLRGSKTSAGYDFYAPTDLVIRPQDKLLFWTDVKAKMADDEVLLLVVRSSSGIKHDLMLANTIGVVDSDYYDNEDNEGNIGICLRNLKPASQILFYAHTRIPVYTTDPIETEDGQKDYKLLLDINKKNEENAVLREIDFSVPVIKNLMDENTVTIKAGDRVAQGFFVKFSQAENCNSEEERTGGIGSTDTKPKKKARKLNKK